MTLVSIILTAYIWGTVCIILFFLLTIARFYQDKSGHRSFYILFLIPIGLFAIAAIRYILLAPNLVGDFWGDLARGLGGVILGGTGFFLLKLMLGGRS